MYYTNVCVRLCAYSCVHSHVNAMYMYYRNVYNKCLKSENVKLVALLYWIFSTVLKSLTGSTIVRFDDLDIIFIFQFLSKEKSTSVFTQKRASLHVVCKIVYTRSFSIVEYLTSSVATAAQSPYSILYIIFRALGCLIIISVM